MEEFVFVGSDVAQKRDELPLYGLFVTQAFTVPFEE